MRSTTIRSLNGAEIVNTTITPETTGTYYLGFHLYSNAGQGIVHVDNISVELDLQVPAITTTGPSYYPNPVKDLLNLNHTDTISQIEVFNLLGQVVLETRPNQQATQLDMSGLSGGSYLVRILSGNTISTIKVFKQ